MPYSANATKFYSKVGEAAEYTEIPYLMEVPEFGGTPEKIDVTVLSDTTKTVSYTHLTMQKYGACTTIIGWQTMQRC